MNGDGGNEAPFVPVSVSAPRGGADYDTGEVLRCKYPAKSNRARAEEGL